MSPILFFTSPTGSLQGAERDIIILATTATRPSPFVGDPLRLNVALTRARRHLLVFGSIGALQETSPVFNEMAGMCRHRPLGYHGSGGSLLLALNSAGAVEDVPLPDRLGPVDETVVNGGAGGDSSGSQMRAVNRQEGIAHDEMMETRDGAGDLISEEAEDDDEGLPSFDLL